MSSGAALKPVAPSLRPSLGGRSPFDPKVVSRAEAALQSLAGRFAEWLGEELQKLDQTHAAVKKEGWTFLTAERLYLRAHDLKGLGTTYGFPIITRIAGSLSRLLGEERRMQAPMALVDAHIEAIKGVVREDIRTEEHPVGGALAAELERSVEAHIAKLG